MKLKLMESDLTLAVTSVEEEEQHQILLAELAEKILYLQHVMVIFEKKKYLPTI